MSAAICFIHVVFGGPAIHDPGLAGALSDPWKAVLSVLWHAVNAILAINAVFLSLAALRWRRNILLLADMLATNLAFVGLLVFYGWMRLGTLAVLPQWILFAVVRDRARPRHQLIASTRPGDHLVLVRRAA